MQEILDYKSYSKRSGLFAWPRKLLFILLLALLIIGTVATFKDGCDTQKERNTSQSKLDKLQNKLDDLHKQGAANANIQLTEMRALRSRLKPFEELASVRYPNATQDLALNKLSKDLAKFGQKTVSIERKLQQRFITREAKNAMLNVLHTTNKCNVDIYFPMGDREAFKLAEQVNACFCEAEWKTNIDSWGGPLSGIHIGKPGTAQSTAFRVVMQAMRLAGTNPMIQKSGEILEGFSTPDNTISVIVGSKE